MAMAADLTWTRELLKAELEDQAEWRRRKAANTPMIAEISIPRRNTSA
jgi:hypothetical protein